MFLHSKCACGLSAIFIEFSCKLVFTAGAIILEHELYINNFDVLEFLQSEVQTVFQSALSAAYPVATPSIVRVDHPSSRGIPAPLPPTKHG